MPWNDPVIITSGILFVWLIAATVFEWTYKPAQQGKKVAYLTLASFVMLSLVMGLLVLGLSQHTKGASGVGFQPAQKTSGLIQDRLEAYPTEEI